MQKFITLNDFKLKLKIILPRFKNFKYLKNHANK